MPERRLSSMDLVVIGSTAKCHDLDHEPSADVVREPGHYEHTCPSCQRRTYFSVDPRGRLG